MMYRVLEDNALFMLIDKSAGVSVHRDVHGNTGSVGLFKQVQQEQGCALWPVHRLDQLTSGLLLLAKSAEIAAEFGRLFESQQVQKCYLAIAEGKPSKKQGVIVGDMAKSRKGSYKLLRTRSNPAKTRFLSHSLAPSLRAYLLRPYSGKTHQLRVAMKSIGVPILGDSRYGGREVDRGYLHAYALAFELRGKSYQFVAPPAQGEYFQLLLDQLSCVGWQDPLALSWGN
ncbi:tRNA pseudouridine32 synthase/23S rRNA pseudouridine746 synthase [Sinobacterium caligoides]|uniref:tRNA pseudouridine32 synthase/23S rRNA pseudouridine746 synthase n=1 Tax=Sinobacterium caligoides TaxID=933926 RepID=A0A3N2DXR0_9GAMM|nr:TIGR01621 family pseudouridine synthase [Sinobacterium caligoides]ROS04650.1 tRNA pseudouridine32 synthase/23S rRNA pseudouridine746 synthase [Sinobacterium caligoides]